MRSPGAVPVPAMLVQAHRRRTSVSGRADAGSASAARTEPVGQLEMFRPWVRHDIGIRRWPRDAAFVVSYGIRIKPSAMTAGGEASRPAPAKREKGWGEGVRRVQTAVIIRSRCHSIALFVVIRMLDER